MRTQCDKCPWKKSTDPHQIPNGYCEQRHSNLKETIQEGTASLLGGMKMMACHESPPGAELPCVGWLIHQLGPGNNLGLRMAVISGAVSAEVQAVGEQHETFEDTLP